MPNVPAETGLGHIQRLIGVRAAHLPQLGSRVALRKPLVECGPIRLSKTFQPVAGVTPSYLRYLYCGEPFSKGHKPSFGLAAAHPVNVAPQIINLGAAAVLFHSEVGTECFHVMR